MPFAALKIDTSTSSVRSFAAVAPWAAVDAAEPGKLPAPASANVAYGPHERHVLDLWQAAGDGPRPLCIFIHGGGWAGGDKADVPPALVEAMLRSNISVASINYRYTRMAKAPAPLYDAARAVQYLRHNAASLKLDPRHFAGTGTIRSLPMARSCRSPAST